MAQNVIINGSSYSNVPYIQIPKSNDSGNATFYDTSDASATAQSHILSGYSAYGASGKIVGNATMPTVTQDGTSHALTIS